jgi:hypothetical protein
MSSPSSSFKPSLNAAKIGKTMTILKWVVIIALLLVIGLSIYSYFASSASQDTGLLGDQQDAQSCTCNVTRSLRNICIGVAVVAGIAYFGVYKENYPTGVGDRTLDELKKAEKGQVILCQPSPISYQTCEVIAKDFTNLTPNDVRERISKQYGLALTEACTNNDTLYLDAVPQGKQTAIVDAASFPACHALYLERKAFAINLMSQEKDNSPCKESESGDIEYHGTKYDCSSGSLKPSKAGLTDEETKWVRLMYTVVKIKKEQIDWTFNEKTGNSALGKLLLVYSKAQPGQTNQAGVRQMTQQYE